MPELCIHGTDGGAVSLERARQVCESIPDCRELVEVEGGAHATDMRYPEVLNQTIRSFLAGLWACPLPGER